MDEKQMGTSMSMSELWLVDLFMAYAAQLQMHKLPHTRFHHQCRAI